MGLSLHLDWQFQRVLPVEFRGTSGADRVLPAGGKQNRPGSSVWRDDPRRNYRLRAGEGNRTLTTSLEGWSSTIELHPRYLRPARSGVPYGRLPFPAIQLGSHFWLSRLVCRAFQEASSKLHVICIADGAALPIVKRVGVAGFEPAKAEPSDLQSDPFGHSGIPPLGLVHATAGSDCLKPRASGGIRTHNHRFTKPELCR